FSCFRHLFLDTKFITKFEFAGVHLAVVGFVVVAAKVQNAVEHQLFYLGFERKAVLRRLLLCLFYGNNNIAKKAVRSLVVRSSTVRSSTVRSSTFRWPLLAVRSSTFRRPLLAVRSSTFRRLFRGHFKLIR